MLDLFGILFSSIIMMLVIFRAVQLDATQPWFRPPKSKPDQSGLRLNKSNEDSPAVRGALRPGPGFRG